MAFTSSLHPSSPILRSTEFSIGDIVTSGGGIGTQLVKSSKTEPVFSCLSCVKKKT